MKTKANVYDPNAIGNASNEQKANRANVAQGGGAKYMEDSRSDWFKNFNEPANETEAELLQKVGRLSELGAPAMLNSTLAPRALMHDVTVNSWGLLTDAKHGGLKLDLTTGFDDDDLFQKVFGSPYKFSEGGVQQLTAYSGVGELNVNHLQPNTNAADNRKFYFLSSEKAWRNGAESSDYLMPEGNDSAKPISMGPNFGQLRDYARFYKNEGMGSNGVYRWGRLFPTAREWNPKYAPYMHIGAAGDQGGNACVSPIHNYVAPIVFSTRIELYLSAHRLPLDVTWPAVTAFKGLGTTDAFDIKRVVGKEYYVFALELRPIFAFYNPYNTTISLPNGLATHLYVNPEVVIEIPRRSDIDDEGNAVTLPARTFTLSALNTNMLAGTSVSLGLYCKESVSIPPGQILYFSPSGGRTWASVKDDSGRNYRPMAEGYRNSGALWAPAAQSSSTNWNGIARTDTPLTTTAMPPIRVPNSGALSIVVKTARLDNPKGRKNAQRVILQASGLPSAGMQAGLALNQFPNMFANYWNVWTPKNQWTETSEEAPMLDVDAAYDVEALERNTAGGVMGTYLAGWGFEMQSFADNGGVRTPRTRVLADHNIRALYGMKEGASRNETDFSMAAPYKWINTNGANRGLLSMGDRPQTDGTYGYWGANNNASSVVLFDLPRRPLLSLGSFRNANLGLYHNETTYIFANSFANPRIRLKDTDTGSTGAQNSDGAAARARDLSWHVNNVLWDKYFFSTLFCDSGSGTQPWTQWKNSQTRIDAHLKDALENPLPNARYWLTPLAKDNGSLSAATLFSTDIDDYYDLAGRIRVNGPFNVNATSTGAWKALLSSMRDRELAKNSGWSASTNNEAAFPRQRTVVGNSGDDYSGFRALSENEIEKLAQAIVAQVKKRGPFRSLADFVNRRVAQGDEMGALDAAIDDAGLNAAHPSGATKGTDSVSGWEHVDSGASQGTGAPGFLMQGDVLEAIAPVITVRGDTFTVRAYGETTGNNGVASARAWCEAVVQRVPEFSDAADAPGTRIIDPDTDAELLSAVNKKFGRKFKIVSFRWLNASEILGN